MTEPAPPPDQADADPDDDDGAAQGRRARDGAADYRMLLTVIAGISLAVAADAMPDLLAGPFLTWLFAAKLTMWFTGVAATVLIYLAVLFGSRLYLRRVEVMATSILALVFLAQAGMFSALRLEPEAVSSRWFVMFAIFCAVAAVEADHGRRVVARHAGTNFGPDVVRVYVASLRQVIVMLAAMAVLALLFAALWPGAPAVAAFVASLLALVAMLVANYQQLRIRTTLAGLGVF